MSRLRIFPTSDLHLEKRTRPKKFYQTLKTPSADVLLLAGDIGNVNSLKSRETYLDFLKEMKLRYKHILLVPGNHEFHGESKFGVSKKSHRNETLDRLNDVCLNTGATLLTKKTIDIDSIAFSGCTLWTHLDRHLEPNRTIFADRLDYLEEFYHDYFWLISELKNPVTKRVVITHHLPTFSLRHPCYKKYATIQSAYYTELIDKFVLNNVALWVCGHTHERMEVQKGNVTLVVNPIPDGETNCVNTRVYEV